MPCATFSMFYGPGGTGCSTWHRKASAKNSSKLNKLLHSEVNLLIQYIIVQDEDGQNNNIHQIFNPDNIFNTYITIITGSLVLCCTNFKFLNLKKF